MEIQEMKAIIEGQRQKAKEKAGHMLAWSEKGPAGYPAIDAIVAVLEVQQSRIEKLEQELAGGAKF